MHTGYVIYTENSSCFCAKHSEDIIIINQGLINPKKKRACDSNTVFYTQQTLNQIVTMECTIFIVISAARRAQALIVHTDVFTIFSLEFFFQVTCPFPL